MKKIIWLTILSIILGIFQAIIKIELGKCFNDQKREKEEK